MNVSLLLMSSALVAGGDPGCAGCSPTPAVSHASVGSACDPCAGESGGLFSKLKSKFGGKPLLFGFGGFKDECGAGGSKPGLLSRLNCFKGKAEPCPCPPACDPCAAAAGGCSLPAVPGVPAATSYSAAPQAMPQPSYSQPQAMPMAAPPAAMPAGRPSPEPMPKPSEVQPKPPGAASGIPAVDAPRI